MEGADTPFPRIPVSTYRLQFNHTFRFNDTAVDAAANTLTIKGEKSEVMFTTTDKTKFAQGKTLANVKVGDKLTVFLP